MFASGKFFFFNPPAAVPAANTDFIIEVDTTKAGSAATHFILRQSTSYSYNFNINWGDGNIEDITTNTNKDHTYASSGIYEIKIKENVVGGFPAVKYAYGGDCAKITKIKQWGTNKWLSMLEAFAGCSNLKITATDTATANTGFVSNWSQAFTSSGIGPEAPLLNFRDATDILALCQGCASITAVGAMIFPKATQCGQVFSQCTNLLSMGEINMSAGTSFGYTFYNCNKLKSFPAVKLGTNARYDNAWQNCTSITGMDAFILGGTGLIFPSTWMGMTALKTFPLISLGAGDPYIADAWRNCTSMTEFPLIDFSGVVTEGFNGAWMGCSAMSAFPLINSSNARRFAKSWSGCTNLKVFPTIKFNAITFGNETFYNCGINNASYSALLIDISGYSTANSINFNANLATYSAAASAARLHLTGTRLWTITDAGLA